MISTRRLKRCVAFMMLMAGSLSAHAEGSTLEVWPANPMVGDQVLASIFIPFMCRQDFAAHPRITLSQVDNLIRARIARDFPGTGCSSLGTNLEFMVGTLPGGDYRLEVEIDGFDPANAGMDFKVSQRDHDANSGPSVDFSGLWWDTTEPGWALSLHQYQGGTIWTSFLTFNADGSSRWVMTLPGAWRNGLYRAQLVEVSNGPDILSQPTGGSSSTPAESEPVGEFELVLYGAPDSVSIAPFRGRMPLKAYVRYTYRGTAHERLLQRFELP